MKKRDYRHTILLFGLTVILPGLIVCGIAGFMINREYNKRMEELEYNRESMKGMLYGNMSLVIDLINQKVAFVEKQLAEPLVLSGDQEEMKHEVMAWKDSVVYVDTPFLLSPDFEFIYTETRGSEADFLRGKTAIPVYENVVVSAREAILREPRDMPVFPDVPLQPVPEQGYISADGRIREDGTPEMAPEMTVPFQIPQADEPESFKEKMRPVPVIPSIPMTTLGEKMITMMNASPEMNAPSVTEDNFSSAPYSVEQYPEKKLRKENIEETLLFDAAAYFAESEKIRSAAYSFARQEGKKISLRKGLPVKNEKDLGDFARMSLFVSEPLRLSEIVQKGKQGIIPVVIDGKPRHIFWKKNEAGCVAGCLIQEKVFMDKIFSVLSQPETTRSFPLRFMILTVTDEKENPVILYSHGPKPANWKYPFLSLEISAVFPYWDLSVYLVDEGMFVSKARTKTLAVWAGVLVVFIIITVAGMFVLRSIYSEMKLASQKTSFVANVSHELKTPLTSIRMLTEMIKTKRQVDETKKEQYLDMMISESERLTRLINDVLDFSSMERGKKTFDFKKINIVSLCAAVIEIQRVRLEQTGFRVNFTSDHDELMVDADEEAIARVIINLLSNAEKFSAETREIGLDISKRHGNVLITVLDRGIGVPPDKAKDLFQEFYRVDSSLTAKVKGTGLGLAIAQRIVKEHKGDITYVSREGGGSVFQVRLPLANR